MKRKINVKINKNVVEVHEKIIPDKVIINGKISEMKVIDKSLRVNGFKIYLDENKNIIKVEINGKHPNADPRTNILCLTDLVIGCPLEEVGVRRIYSLLTLWKLDYCYFKPIGKFHLTK